MAGPMKSDRKLSNGPASVQAVIPGRCEASNPESRDSGSGANAPSRNDGPTTGALRLQPSQLPRISERERRHSPGVLIEDQGAGDRRLGALAAVFALAKPAVDANRRALGLFEIDSRGVDQARRM